MHDVAILLLAAGASTRMGRRDKLLEDVDGTPLIRRQALVAKATRAPVYVTLHPDKPNRAAALQGVEITPVYVQMSDPGMGDSIAAGVGALPVTVTGVAILPADMPDITTSDLTNICAAFQQDPHKIHRATSQTGTMGHPVIFPKRLFADLQTLTGDQGARDLLKRETVKTTKLPANHAITDLDTPQAWEAWRKARPDTSKI